MSTLDVKPLNIKEKNPEGILNESALLPNCPRRVTVWGRSGSGKTWFVIHILTQMFHKPVGGICLICKNANQESYQALEKWAEKNDWPYEQGEVLDEELFHALVENDTPKLLIFDDLTATDDITYLNKAYQHGRVQNLYCVCISQNYRSIPVMVRNNSNLFIIFPLSSPHIANSIINAISNFVSYPEELKRAYNMITKPKYIHSCLFLQIDGDQSALFTKDGKLFSIEDFKPLKIKDRKKGKKDSESDSTDLESSD